MGPRSNPARQDQGTVLTVEEIDSFRTLIYGYHRSHPRPMPWRETDDPYAILVSEIMLQQTQVERVRKKYVEFLDAFPTPTALVAASLAEVLRVWQGLGYNRRAIALQRCCTAIMTRFNGNMPGEIEALETLPGIGFYTARAVAAFAFGIAAPLIETNIRTVFLHLFFAGREQVTDRDIMPLVSATLDCGNPREWYYALMDYGVMLKQAHPNPGRRSAHHTRQSPFRGSNRELRSRILSAVLAESGVSTAQLQARLEVEATPLEQNLEDLQREGFLIRVGTTFMVAGQSTAN